FRAGAAAISLPSGRTESTACMLMFGAALEPDRSRPELGVAGCRSASRGNTARQYRQYCQRSRGDTPQAKLARRHRIVVTPFKPFVKRGHLSMDNSTLES